MDISPIGSAASTAGAVRDRIVRLGWPAVVSGVAAIALVMDPARWLVETWRDPSYQSEGGFVALGIAALLAVSVASGPAQPDPRAVRVAWRLLLGTAAVRVVGHLLAVDTIGALALVVDLGALAVALGVDRRPFALRPLAVAGLGVLALPLENLLQRLLGHPLQLAAAAGAEAVLAPFRPDVVREGVLLLHPDVLLAVDLPCSGARGLLLLCGLALGFWCRRQVSLPRALLGAAAVVGGAFVANASRVIVLFEGARAGWPLHDEPWHTLLGCGVLAIGALPVFVVALRSTPRQPRWQRPFGVAKPSFSPGRLSPVLASTLVCAAALVAWTPARPLDVSEPVAGRRLPAAIGNRVGTPLPPSGQERLYYERYGGSLEKRVYGDGRDSHAVLLVRTGAPLRHLHGPDRCLIGAGHTVTRLGVRHGATPSIIYRSVAPDGSLWRVEASFVDDAGRSAASVSEVLWRWLDEPRAWSLVERIAPWSLCEADPERCSAFDAELFAALDLPSSISDRSLPDRSLPGPRS